MLLKSPEESPIIEQLNMKRIAGQQLLFLDEEEAEYN